MTFRNEVPFDNWETPYSDYTPFLTNITAITNSNPAVVTTSQTVPYTLGELVSFRVSQPYAMTQINNLVGLVLAVNGSSFTVNLNTTTFTPFQYPPVGTVIYPAVAVPAGSGVVPNSPIAMTNIEDAFDNVPLNVDNA
jgi:hypothetical protein